MLGGSCWVAGHPLVPPPCHCCPAPRLAPPCICMLRTGLWFCCLQAASSCGVGACQHQGLIHDAYMAYAPRVICLWSQLAKVNSILFGSHAAVAVALLLPAWLLLCVVVPAVNHHTALHIVCGAPLRAHTTGDCGVFLSLLCLSGGCGPPSGHVTYSVAKGAVVLCVLLSVCSFHTPKKNHRRLRRCLWLSCLVWGSLRLSLLLLLQWWCGLGGCSCLLCCRPRRVGCRCRCRLDSGAGVTR